MLTSPIPWSRYVALGDSLTEGVGDPGRGSLVGWADRLARSLKALDPELRYWNLGRRSLTVEQVHDTQIERAVALQPDLASVVVGMNDLMAPRFDIERYRADLTEIVRTMADTGATLLMGTFPKDLPLLRLMPRAVARERRARLQDASDVVLQVAADHDAVCADAPPGWRYRMDECSIDGCHPNAKGHAHIAELALRVLCERAGIPVPVPEQGVDGWVPTSVRHLRWLAAEGYLRRPLRLLAERRGS